MNEQHSAGSTDPDNSEARVLGSYSAFTGLPLEPGLTKREWFAGLAMQALAGAYADGGLSHASHCARLAVEHADFLLKELAKP